MIRRLDARALGRRRRRRARSSGRPRAVRRPTSTRRGRRDRRRRARARATPRCSSYTARFDRVRPGAAAGARDRARRSSTAAERALGAGDARPRSRYAAERIERFHAAALPKSWRMTDEHGSRARPGGAAARPRRHLRPGRPRRLSLDGADDGGPGARGRRPRDRAGHAARAPTAASTPAVLAAARVAGVTEALPRGRRAGGRRARLRHRDHPARGQDRRARATSTSRSPRRRVFGEVGIDMVAGPSEVRGGRRRGRRSRPGRRRPARPGRARPDGARACCSPTSRALAAARRGGARARSSRALPRRAIAAEALASQRRARARRRASTTRWTLANRLAPEHLELHGGRAGRRCCRACATRARCSSGAHTPEVVGDYVAGPNHVLPTGGTARFASPLGTEDFVKRSSVIEYSPAGLAAALAAPGARWRASRGWTATARRRRCASQRGRQR